MMISFGGGGSAAYLTGAQDSKGRERESVDVLSGDPFEVEKLADSLSFEHKSTTAVIAWAPGDDPTDAQIREVLHEFEKTAWAGLEPDRYAWSAVEHRDGNGGVHLHVLTARVDLETGKSLNIAPPGWEKTFDALRDWQNYKNDWGRPDDPARARDYEPGHQARIDADLRRSGLPGAKDSRRVITDYLRQRIQSGTVQDRETMVSALREARLDVPRQGKHYITVRDPSSNDRWRLKGGIYEQTWKPEFTRGAAATADRGGPEADRATPETNRGDPERRAQDALGKLEAARTRRSEFNRARYGVSQPQRDRDPEAARPAGGVPRLERLSLGTLTVNWALGQWQSSRIENLKEERARLEAEIEGQRLTLERLNEKTWGVQLVKDDQGPLVVLPKGALPNPKWIWRGLPAVPLPTK